MTLKLSYKRLFKPIVRLAIVVSCILIIAIIYSGGITSDLWVGIVIILCIPVLPTVYLFCEYYLASSNKTIEVTKEGIRILLTNGDIFNYNISHLVNIKLFKSANIEKGNFAMQTAEMYYHAEIFTINGDKILITSVLEPGIDEVIEILKGVELEVIRTVYSTMYF